MCVCIYIVSRVFCMLLLGKQKIDSGFVLFEAEQNAKKERIEKRQAKHKQNSFGEEIIAISSSGKTTATDEEAV